MLIGEKERVKALLKETVVLLCKNGLDFKDHLSLEALIGITVDKNEVLLISINEALTKDSKTDDFRYVSQSDVPIEQMTYYSACDGVGEAMENEADSNSGVEDNEKDRTYNGRMRRTSKCKVKSKLRRLRKMSWKYNMEGVQKNNNGVVYNNNNNNNVSNNINESISNTSSNNNNTNNTTNERNSEQITEACLNEQEEGGMNDCLFNEGEPNLKTEPIEENDDDDDDDDDLKNNNNNNNNDFNNINAAMNSINQNNINSTSDATSYSCGTSNNNTMSTNTFNNNNNNNDNFNNNNNNNNSNNSIGDSSIPSCENILKKPDQSIMVGFVVVYGGLW